MRAEISPQLYARIGGLFYLIIIIAGGFAQFSRGNLVVSGDAAATARNIVVSESLFRIGVAGEMMTLVFAVALTVILYVLFRPVSKTLALLAAFFALVSIAIEGTSIVSFFAVLSIVKGAGYLSAFAPDQLNALAYLSLGLFEYGFGISLVFFGFCLFLYGFLIFRSGYFPKWLGVFVIIGSVCF